MVSRRSRRLAPVLAGIAVSVACGAEPETGRPTVDQTDGPRDFVGSAACESCHEDVYGRWQGTLMANVLQDPRERPEAVLGDFATPDPLVTFSLDDVAFTYGGKWKQRYFTRVGNDLFVQPAQWDVRNHLWRPYTPRRDWWVPHYPDDPRQRPTGPLCDGCHSVNYDLATRTVTEWNVGCEACHGPGSAHLDAPVAETIVNPARLDDVRADDVCIRCHSQGQPPQNPIEGFQVDWPVGYQPGDRLREFWELDEPHLGEDTFTHWPEGSAHKNRMQGNDYVQSLMSARGVRCYACHDVHGTEFDADLRKPEDGTCLECHGPQLQPGPRGTVAFHTQHAEDSEGSRCVACHMPAIARTIGDVTVRSHTFRFVTPSMTAQYGVPNPCTSCHTDRSLEWATEQLEMWPSVSPWRVG